MRRTLAILLVVGLVALLTIPALASVEDNGGNDGGWNGGHGWSKNIKIDVEANLDSKNTSADSDAKASHIGNLNDASSGDAYANGNDPGTNEIKNASVSVAISSSKKHSKWGSKKAEATAENTTGNTITNWGSATATSGAANATQNGSNNVNANSTATAEGCCDGNNAHGECGTTCDGPQKCPKHKKGIVINAELNKDSKNTSADSDAKVKYVGNSNYAYTGNATAYGNQGGGTIHNLSVAAAIGGKATATNTTTNSISNTGTATATSGNATANQEGDNNVNATSTATALAN